MPHASDQHGAPQRSYSHARPATAVAVSTAMALAGYRRGALTVSGAAGAVLVGSSTYLAGGWRWSALLLAFFGSSSALSRLESRSPSGAAIAAMAARGSRRDLVQALANGGVAAGAALAVSLKADRARPDARLAAAFAGALAAANADTWATELGGLSSSAPRLISTGKVVRAGTSGAVTPAGLAGAALGGLLIGAAAGLVQAAQPSARHALSVTLAGVVGSLADSVAGALLQASYHCPRCDRPTERRIHGCGTPTALVRGKSWCTNDVVNLLCTATGALMGVMMTESCPAKPTSAVAKIE